MKALATLFLFTMLTLPAAERDPATGLVFPDEVNAWVFDEKRTYQSANLGVSYSYKLRHEAPGVITCFVYNNGIRWIPQGVDSGFAERQMAAAVTDLRVAWGARGAVVEELLPVKTIQDRRRRRVAMVGVYRIHGPETGEAVTVCGLTAFKGNFIKIRYTVPGGKAEPALRFFGDFVLSLRAHNEKQLGRFFFPDRE